MKKTTAAGIAALAAILIAGCAKPPPAGQVLRKTAAAYQKAKTLKIEARNSADFRIDNQWQGRGSLVLTEFVRPDKVRQQVVGVKNPSFVSDGKKAHFYVDQMQTYVQVQPERLLADLSGDPSGVHVLRLAIEKDPFKGIKGAKMLGDEKISGVDCYTVQFTPAKGLPMPGLEKAKLNEKLWIGKQDFLVRKGALVARQKTPGPQGGHEVIVTLTTVLTKQEIHKAIPNSEFTLPKGAKVTQMPAMPSVPPGEDSGKTGR